MHGDSLFAGMLLDRPSMLRRLFEEVTEASLQFRSDPRNFVRSFFKNDLPGNRQRTNLLRFGLAIGVAAYALAFSAMLVAWSGGSHVARPLLIFRYDYTPLGPSLKPITQKDADDASKSRG